LASGDLIAVMHIDLRDSAGNAGAGRQGANTLNRAEYRR
jgi:hypothetical protein